MSVKKYFLAVVIPSPLFEKAETVKQELFEQHGLKGALRSPAHITLHRPFEWKEEKENMLIEKLKNFNFIEGFKIELNDFSFFEPRVIYIALFPNQQLEELHRQLTGFAKKELKLFNEADDLRGFHPHITVASRDMKKQKFYELHPIFKEKKMSGAFNCSEFCLLKLESKWEVVARFQAQSNI